MCILKLPLGFLDQVEGSTIGFLWRGKYIHQRGKCLVNGIMCVSQRKLVVYVYLRMLLFWSKVCSNSGINLIPPRQNLFSKNITHMARSHKIQTLEDLLVERLLEATEFFLDLYLLRNLEWEILLDCGKMNG